jgi:hypothetical protein
MLRQLAELLEREFPVLLSRPWLFALALVLFVVILVAGWLVTAWRLGKWYYSREIAALRAGNTWLQRQVRFFLGKAEFLERTRAGSPVRRHREDPKR